MKQRPIIELLQIMLDNVDMIGSGLGLHKLGGLCELYTKLFLLKEISGTEATELNYYFIKRGKKLNLNTGEYWFPPRHSGAKEKMVAGRNSDVETQKTGIMKDLLTTPIEIPAWLYWATIAYLAIQAIVTARNLTKNKK